jgi:hypothetical protein
LLSLSLVPSSLLWAPWTLLTNVFISPSLFMVFQLLFETICWGLHQLTPLRIAPVQYSIGFVNVQVLWDVLGTFRVDSFLGSYNPFKLFLDHSTVGTGSSTLSILRDLDVTFSLLTLWV